MPGAEAAKAEVMASSMEELRIVEGEGQAGDNSVVASGTFFIVVNSLICGQNLPFFLDTSSFMGMLFGFFFVICHFEAQL